MLNFVKCSFPRAIFYKVAPIYTKIIEKFLTLTQKEES